MGRRVFALLALAFVVVPACDETSKQCFGDDAASVKNQVSACGELCDKDDGKACAKQVELANEACIEGGDAEICRWMCDYAKDGKEVYCKKHEELKAAK